MHSFTIEKNEKSGTVFLPYCFVDQYMNRLPGDAVRVYLYLLRHASGTSSALTVSALAASLSVSEPEVLQAFRALEAVRLLAIAWENDSFPISIHLLDCVPQDSASIYVEEQIKKRAPQLLGADAGDSGTVPARRPRDAKDFSLCSDDEDAKALFYVAGKYLGRSLTPTDVDSILYYREDLNFSWDLIEYLIEYCTSGGHKKFAYIDKVAVSWFEAKVKTIEDAKAESKRYSDQYFKVIRAFGIKDRHLAKTEEDMLLRWTNEYGFSTDIIIEACDRTVKKINRASFDYADSILKRWSEQGVTTLEDVKRVDSEFQAQKAEKSAADQTAARTFSGAAKTNQGIQRSYSSSDLKELERRLSPGQKK